MRLAVDDAAEDLSEGSQALSAPNLSPTKSLGVLHGVGREVRTKCGLPNVLELFSLPGIRDAAT